MRLRTSLLILAIGLMIQARAADKLPLIIKSDNGIVYTIMAVKVTSHYGNATAVDDTTYLLIKLSAKNTEPKTQFLGGPFASNFKASQGSFSYNVDKGVGFQSDDAYSGTAELVSLIPVVAFTIPKEIAKGEWMVTTPTGNNFTVALAN